MKKRLGVQTAQPSCNQTSLNIESSISVLSAFSLRIKMVLEIISHLSEKSRARIKLATLVVPNQGIF